MNTEIAKIQICQNLSLQETLIVKASMSTKIKNMPSKELKSALNDILSRSYFDCRYSIPEKEDFKLILDELCKDISNYFTTVSIDEIKLCFHNGCRKMYGDFMGLSNATFFEWLQKFVSSSERQQALKKQREFLNPPAKELTEEEKKEKIKKGCLQLFEEFKRTNNVPDAGNVNYNYLDSIKVIPFNKERKNEFIKQAQNKLIIEAKEDKKNAKDINVIRDAIKKLEELNNDKSSKIIIEAKKIALNTFFKELIEIGTELKDLIDC